MKLPTLGFLVVVTTSLAACERSDTPTLSDRSAEQQAADDHQTASGSASPSVEEETVASEREPVAGHVSDPDELKDAKELLRYTSELVDDMKADPKLRELVRKSAGVFFIPRYGRAALGIGAQGGRGVLMAKRDQKWTCPGLYDVGGISVGAQVGAEGGELVMLLMNEQALAPFKQEHDFSLNADAKLTMVDYSKAAEASSPVRGDVVFWSSTKGAFVGASLGAQDISWDADENAAFYGAKLKPEAVLRGNVVCEDNALRSQLTEL